MKIKTLELQNFRRFEQASIEFPDNNLAVFIGSNGRGKSSILDALGILLTPLFRQQYQTNEIKAFYKAIKSPLFSMQGNIKNQNNVAKLGLGLQAEKNDYTWSFIIKQKANEPEITIRYEDEYLIDYQDNLLKKLIRNSNYSIPILTYYRTDRIIYKNYKFAKKSEYRFPQLEVYQFDFNILGSNFDNFVNWFRQEEDIENEIMRKERNFSLISPKLEVVRVSFKNFFNHLEESIYQNLRAEREGNTSTLIISKNGEDFSLAQLSDGEKMLLAMVGDIARRLAIANPILGEKAFEGEGVVLIDEIELHLHPRWQRLVLPALQATFPNVQFIVTTHSPQVLSEVKAESIFILRENGIFHPSTNPLGRDSNAILEQVMETTERPQDVQNDIEKYLSLIQNNKIEEANVLKVSLLTRLDAEDTVFTKADAILFKKQLLNS